MSWFLVLIGYGMNATITTVPMDSRELCEAALKQVAPPGNVVDQVGGYCVRTK